VLGACLSKVWCFARLFIASPSGRQRFNVLGAVDAVTTALKNRFSGEPHRQRKLGGGGKKKQGDLFLGMTRHGFAVHQDMA
jgi:hypothetical protein